MDGWPAWPAMVDEDPETGEYFLADEAKVEELEQKPSFYHVLFFDTSEKNGTRAWIPESAFEKFTEQNLSKRKRSQRLQNSIKMAKEAMKEILEVRREKYSLAARFKITFESSSFSANKSGEDDDEEHENDSVVKKKQK